MRGEKKKNRNIAKFYSKGNLKNNDRKCASRAHPIQLQLLCFELGGCPSFCRELTCSLRRGWSQAEAAGGIAAAEPFDIKSKDSLQEEKKRESLTYLQSVLFLGGEVVDIAFEVISTIKLHV